MVARQGGSSRHSCFLPQVQTPDQEGLYQLNESKDHRVLGSGRVPQLGRIIAVVRHRRDINLDTYN